MCVFPHFNLICNIRISLPGSTTASFCRVELSNCESHYPVVSCSLPFFFGLCVSKYLSLSLLAISPCDCVCCVCPCVYNCLCLRSLPTLLNAHHFSTWLVMPRSLPSHVCLFYVHSVHWRVSTCEGHETAYVLALITLRVYRAAAWVLLKSTEGACF